MIERLAFLAGTAFLLAACGSDGTREMGDVRHRITTDRVTAQQQISTAADTGLADPEGLAVLDLFLRRLDVGYGDRLIVFGAGEHARRDLAAGLDRLGHNVIIDRQQAENTPLTVRLERLAVTPPNCGDWTHSPQPDHSNLPPRNFGCAMQSNLARMIADPNDLLEGRGGTIAGNSQRDVAGIRAYRANNLEPVSGTADAVTTGD